MSNYSSEFIDDGSSYLGSHLLEVSESNLIFELNIAGERTEPQTVDVTNGGTARIVIRAVSITVGSDDFELTNSNDYPDYLDPGETFNIVVDFLARVDGVATGAVQIFTNETDQTPYTIELKSRTEREPQFDDMYQDVRDRIDNEADLRENADTTLGSTLTTLINTKVATEATSRTNAISAAKTELRGEYNPKFATETAARVAAISAAMTTLRGEYNPAITSEVAARIAADLAVKTALRGEFNPAIADETTARGTAITQLRNLLRGEFAAADSAEVTARTSADNAVKIALRNEFTPAIATAVNAEKALREAADTVESTARGVLNTTLQALIASSVATEATARTSADNGVKSTLRSEITDAVTVERVARQSADTLAALALSTADTAIRATITSSVSAEAVLRADGDASLAARLTLVEEAQSDDTVFGVDLEARTAITLEISNRITAVSAEATARLALESSFTTALSTSIASVTSQISTLATTQGAQATAISTIQATYQTAGQVTSIASALVQTEMTARVAADLAESTARLALAATLRSETTSAVGSEATIRAASLLSEQTARVDGDTSLANSILSLNSQTTNARGLTLNGNFSAGTAGWISNMTFVSAGGRITPTSAAGQYNLIYSTPAILIDTARAYQINASFRVFVAACKVIVGVRCYDASGNLLGIVADDEAGGANIFGAKTVQNIISGTENYATPITKIGTKFPTGTVKIEICLLANYPDPTPVALAYVEVYGLWLDDVTQATVVNARVTQEVQTLTTATEAIATQVETLEADFTSVTGDVSDLVDNVASNTSAIVTANARIDTEQTARANAVSAEATRVDGIFTNYTTTSGMNSAITTATTAEATARTTAISNAMSAEVTRTNGIFATYTNTTGMNSAISTAVSAEATSRTTAIASAMGAEVTRVDSLIASYTTTTGMNSAITTAVNAEATNRTTAISTAMGAEVTRVNNLLASYTTTTGMNSAITTAVNAEITNRNSAIATSVNAEATRVDNIFATYYSTTDVTNTAIAAAVLTETNARAAADTALSSNITTVSTTVGGLSSTVTSHTSSLNGILAKAGLTLNVNGYITGWSLNNDGNAGTFDIVASAFRISDGSNPGVIPFEIVGGVTRIKTAVIGDATIENAKIANLTLDTNKIKDFAITQSGSIFYNFGGYAYPTKLVWWSFPSQSIHVFVGDGEGDYTFVYDPFGESYYWNYTPGTGDHDLVTTQFEVTIHTADSTNEAQMVHLEAMITIERDGSSDDYLALRVIRTNDNVLMPEIYNNIRVRSGRQPVAFFFKDGDPIKNADNTYKLQIYYNTDTARFYETTLRATLYRK